MISTLLLPLYLAILRSVCKAMLKIAMVGDAVPMSRSWVKRSVTIWLLHDGDVEKVGKAL